MLEFEELFTHKKLESLQELLNWGIVEVGKKEAREFIIKNPNKWESVDIKYKILAWNYEKEAYIDTEPDIFVIGIPESMEPGGKTKVTVVFEPKTTRIKSLKAAIDWNLRVG